MSKLKYTPEQKTFLLEQNINGKHFSELATLFNRQFSTDLTTQQIRHFYVVRKIKNNLPLTGDCYRWTKAEISFLEKLSGEKTNKELVSLLNNTFKLSLTRNQVYKACSLYKIKTVRDPRDSTKFYTDEQIEWLKTNADNETSRGLTDKFNNNFKTDFEVPYIRELCLKFKIEIGKKGQSPNAIFTPEIMAFIKDCYDKLIERKEIVNMVNARFNTSYSYSQIVHHMRLKGMKVNAKEGKLVIFEKYDESLGYNFIKVSRTNGSSNGHWKHKHIFVWEQENGPVPKGYFVIHLNRNKTDDRRENLACISKAVFGYMSLTGLLFDDIERTKAGIKIAELVLKIQERKNDIQKRHPKQPHRRIDRGYAPDTVFIIKQHGNTQTRLDSVRL